jgi:hypothetical protein
VTTHFANLSRGLLCPGFSYDWHYSHIQSTHCEQKQWDKVIMGAGVDLLYRLATDEPVIVHDLSEKNRPTRATWQGVEWIRYAASRCWNLPYEGVRGRGGRSMEQYFSTVYREDLPLLPSLRKYVVHRNSPIRMVGLDCRDLMEATCPVRSAETSESSPTTRLEAV